MKKINKKYFTLPEVTMAIAILGIGMLSILGVFPVAIKSGLQAVKISESIHKARSAAHLWQTFAESATTNLTGIKPDAFSFAFTDSLTDNLYGVGVTAFTKDVAKSKSNISNLDISKVLNGKFQLDRVTMTVGTDFTTSFYVLKPN